jgi:hypothetical protein
VPAEIARIAYWNKRAVYGLLFRASAQTVSIIAADLKRLGARVGMTSVLHTWGSALTHHPHVHMIVSGGGLSRLFRRLFIEGLLALHHAGELTFFGDLLGLSDPQAFSAYLAPLPKIEWVVIVPEARLRHVAKPPFGGSEAVLASSKRKVDIAKVRTLLSAHPPQTRRHASRRSRPTHIARTRPRLWRRTVQHRDFPTRPKTAIPRTTPRSRCMTRRTSPFNGHTLNSNAFEADTGLPAALFKMLNVPELGEILLVREVRALQNSARKTQPHHLGLTLAGLASRFPHRAHLDPTASS